MAGKIDLGAALGKAFEGYLKMPLLQKIIYPLLIIGSVAGIVFVSNIASRPGYAVLFTDLGPADSAAVIERLKEQKIAYQIRGDGGTIAITPPEAVHELRISLAAEGVPKGGKVGFELFDVTNLGTTTFEEKIRWTRAVQGELQRTIEAMDAVNSARVAIAKPEKSVFSKKENQTTASVMLTLRPGVELGKKQIKGITNLVAGSIEGLLPENVTIVDMYGNLLTPDEDEEEGLVAEATRLQYKTALEKGYVRQIEQMLSKVLGPEKIIARVTANLDFSANEREEEIYDPGGQVVRSERSIERGTGFSQRGGIPGVISNLSNDPDLITPPGSDESKSSQKEMLKNYEVSRAVTKVSAPRGRLINLSVAVGVDGNYENVTDAAGQNIKTVYKPLDEGMLAQIESLVKSAVGYDASRGDVVTVENVPFSTKPVDFEEVWSSSEQWWHWANRILPYVVPLLLFFGFLVIVIKPFINYLTTPTEAEIDLTRLLPTGIAELEAELEAERQRTKIPEIEQRVDMDQLNEIMAENSKMVKENPEQAALLIRYWLNDGRM
ncbi:MAG: flagellar basal-body MS-ring/collar protein FliF [Bdellovibrionota bacterium]